MKACTQKQSQTPEQLYPARQTRTNHRNEKTESMNYTKPAHLETNERPVSNMLSHTAFQGRENRKAGTSYKAEEQIPLNEIPEAGYKRHADTNGKEADFRASSIRVLFINCYHECWVKGFQILLWKVPEIFNPFFEQFPCVFNRINSHGRAPRRTDKHGYPIKEYDNRTLEEGAKL